MSLAKRRGSLDDMVEPMSTVWDITTEQAWRVRKLVRTQPDEDHLAEILGLPTPVLGWEQWVIRRSALRR